MGTVKDSAGASVPGATVTVTNRETQLVVRTVQSNEEGQYTIGDLPATNYDVSFEAKASRSRSKVTLRSTSEFVALWMQLGCR